MQLFSFSYSNTQRLKISSLWSTSLFFMWCWSCRYCWFCEILHMAIEPAAVMMKKALLLHKNPWAIALSLSHSLTPHNPRASQVDPNAISSLLPPPPPPANFLMGQQFQTECHQSEPQHIKGMTCTSVTLISQSTSTVFLLFGRGIVLCKYPIYRSQDCWNLSRKLDKSEKLLQTIEGLS
jgi:hypothetical protein